MANDTDWNVHRLLWSIVAAVAVLNGVGNDAGETDAEQVDSGSHFGLDHGLHRSQLLIVLLCDQLLDLLLNLLLDLLLNLLLDIPLQQRQLWFNIL